MNSSEGFVTQKGYYGSPNLKEQREWMNSLTCIKMELDGSDNIEKNASLIVEAWNNEKLSS